MFKSIQAKNLFSWEDLNYEIKPGISQVGGWNVDDCTSEGSGKSSVFNILCWTLYGSIPKDAKVDEVVREGCKGGAGTVTLENEYRIHRSRKPNDLYIAKSDGEIVKGKDARETQILINKLIGLDFEAFCQTVYFAQNYPNKFISAGETDKARILSEVQDLTIFDRARKQVLEKIKVVDTTLVDLDRQLTAVEAEESKLESNAKIITQYVQKFEADKAAALVNLGAQSERLVAKIEDLQTALENSDSDSAQAEFEQIDELLKDLAEQKIEHSTAIKVAEAANAERLRLKQYVDSFHGKIQRIDSKVSKTILRIHQDDEKQGRLTAKLEALEASETEPGNCPTCGQTASEAMLQRHKDQVKRQLRDLAAEIKGLDEQIEEYKAELIAAEAEIEELRAEQTEATKKLAAAKDVPSAEQAQKALKKIEAETQELLGVRRTIQAAQAQASRNEADLRTAKSALKQVEKDRKSVKGSECLKEYEKLATIDSALEQLTDKRGDVKKRYVESTTNRNNLEILKTGFKEVKQYVFQSLLRELSVKSTALAAELFEVPVRVEFNNEDAEDGGVSKIKTLVTLDGCERSLGLLSGGQFSRVALAVNLALSDVVGQRGSNPIDLIVLDEPFQNLSTSSKEKVIKLLESRAKKTVLIEHDELIKTIVNTVFSVELRDGISRQVV